MFSSGCVSANYNIRQDELVRLAHLSPDDRWRAVHATQRVRGGDDPPERWELVADPRVPPTDAPSVQPAPAPTAVVPVLAVPMNAPGVSRHRGPGNTGSPFRTGSGGDPLGTLLVVGIAALVGSVITLGIMIPTEAIRYDGYLAVNPDEPIYVRLRHERARGVIPLSALHENLAAAAHDGARIFEGDTPHYQRLGRLPLQRDGFTATIAGLASSIPLRGGGTEFAYGLHLTGGFNILQWVTIAIGVDVVGAWNTTQTLANVGLEATMYPSRYGGIYTGIASAGRGTNTGGQQSSEGE